MERKELIRELAERALEGRLAFFIGSGFSKAVIGEDRALSWLELLRQVADLLHIKDVVPDEKYKGPLDCPQIASNIVKELCKYKKGIRKTTRKRTTEFRVSAIDVLSSASVN